MSYDQNYDEEIISLLINSINEIQIQKIYIGLRGNNETNIRICRKFHQIILNFQTINIASNDVRLKFI